MALLTFALLAPAGCDQSAPTGQGTGGEVRLGYFANVTHAQAVIGVANGEYALAVGPNKLTTRVFNAGPSLVAALLAGEIDIGYVGPGPVLSAHDRSHGKGLRVVAGAAANGVLVVARKESSIQKMDDLKGKKIATPQLGNTQDVSAKHFLMSQLKQQDVDNVLAVNNSEQAALMARGDVDAAWVPEPWGSRLIVENGARLLAEEKDLWPEKEFILTLVVTTPEYLAKHGDVVEKLLGAQMRVTHGLATHPEQYSADLDAAIGKLAGKRLPEGVVANSLKYVKFTDEPLEQTFTQMGEWAFDLKMLSQRPQLEGLFDLTALHKLEKMFSPATTQAAEDARVGS